MDSSGLLFVIVLLVVSGFIAWAGDVLGRVLGKKRIALFGLRPRRTSTLIGILTGMLITGLTIMTLALASEEVRDMLIRIGAIRQELTELRDEREGLITDLNESRRANDALQGIIAEGQIELENYRMQISTYEGEVLLLTEQSDALQTKLDDISTEIRILESERDDLLEENQALGTQNANLEASVTDLNNQISDAQATVVSLNLDIDEKNQQIETLNGHIDYMNLRVLELTGQVAVLELGEVKVFQGQQLGVVMVDTSQSINVIEPSLRLWISRIPATYRDPETGDMVLSQNPVNLNEDSLNDALAAISESHAERAIVLAYAEANVAEDSVVPVRVEVTPNYLIFAEGSLIYSQVFSEPVGSEDQPHRGTFAQFFRETRDYLLNERHIIPTTAGEVLQLTFDDLSELALRLEDAGYPAELRIIALKDIYRTDFLVYGDQFTVTILPGESASGTVEPDSGLDPE